MNTHKVLVVVDYQNDFVNGVLGFEGAELLETKIISYIKEYLENDDQILYTFDTHLGNYLNTREGKNLPKKHCIFGTEGWEHYGKLREYTPRLYPNNIYGFAKYNSFGFNMSGDELNDVINYNESTLGNIQFTICGLVTNLCVLSVAISLQNIYPNAEIIIDASCCTSFDKELHEKALDIMNGLQMKIINR